MLYVTVPGFKRTSLSRQLTRKHQSSNNGGTEKHVYVVKLECDVQETELMSHAIRKTVNHVVTLLRFGNTVTMIHKSLPLTSNYT